MAKIALVVIQLDDDRLDADYTEDDFTSDLEDDLKNCLSEAEHNSLEVFYSNLK